MVGNSIEHAIKVEKEIQKDVEQFELELCGEHRDDFECTLEDLEKEIIAERRLMKEYEDKMKSIDRILLDLSQ